MEPRHFTLGPVNCMRKLLGFLVSFLAVGLLAADNPVLRTPLTTNQTALHAGANTTFTVGGDNSITINSAAGGSGAQLNGTNVWTGTNIFSGVFGFGALPTFDTLIGIDNSSNIINIQLNSNQLNKQSTGLGGTKLLSIIPGVLLTNPVVNSGTISGDGSGLTNLNLGTNFTPVFDNIQVAGNALIGSIGTNYVYPLTVANISIASISNSPIMTLGHIQGMASDNTNYLEYVTTSLVLLSNNFTMIRSNMTPFTGLPGPPIHIAPGYWNPADNQYYGIAEIYDGVSSGTFIQILSFNQSLTRTGAHMLSGVPPAADGFSEGSGMVLVPADGIIYTTAFNTNRIYKWDSTTYAYLGYIQEDIPNVLAQGIIYTNGIFLIVSGSSFGQVSLSGGVYRFDKFGHALQALPYNQNIASGSFLAEGFTFINGNQIAQSLEVFGGSQLYFVSLVTNIYGNWDNFGNFTNVGSDYASSFLLPSITPQVGIKADGSVNSPVFRSKVTSATYDIILRQANVNQAGVYYNLTTAATAEDSSKVAFGQLIDTGAGAFELFSVPSGGSFVIAESMDGNGNTTWVGNHTFNNNILGKGNLTVAGTFVPESVIPSSIPFVNASTQMVALTVGSGLSLSVGGALTATGSSATYNNNNLTNTGTVIQLADNPKMTNPVVTGSEMITNGTTTDPVDITGTINNYFEVFLQNLSNGNQASADLVLANDLSSNTDTNHILDIFINSSGYTATIYGTNNDAGMAAGLFTTNLYVIDQATNGHVRIAVGGQYPTNTVADFTTNGVTITNNIAWTGVATGNGSGITALNASSISSGTVPAAQMPALTGDITTSAGSVATTLKNTGTAGTYFKATYDVQGRETSGSNPTTVAGFGIVDAVSTNGPTIFGANFLPLSGISNSAVVNDGMWFLNTTNQPALMISNVWDNGASIAPVVDITATWNTTGTSPTAFRLDVTNTASAGTALLEDLQVSGVSKFKVSLTGVVTAASSLSCAAITMTGTSSLTTGGDAIFSTVGRGIQLKGGTNGRIGTATLSSGTVTVANSSVTASTQILLTIKVAGGTGVGIPTVGTVSAGTSFIINSLIPGGLVTQTLDNSQITWMLVEQN